MTRTPLRRTTVLLIVIAALAVGLVWGIGGALGVVASPSPAGGGGSDKVVLQIGYLEDIDSLNPFIGYAGVAYDTFYENYDTLVNYDAATMQPIPGLAESWETSDDGLTWTFKLRQDAKWQDGEPLTADDVAFTFNYIVDNEMGAFTSYTYAIKKATAIDDHTVEITTTKPKPSILQMLVPILPEHLWSNIDPKDANNKYQNPPPIVGSGPYQVVEWKKGEFCRMVANKDYWGGAPKVDELIFRFYTNQDSMSADFELGAIQYAQLPPVQFKSLEGTEGVTVSKAQEDTFDELGFNCYTGPSKGHPALQDPAFRKALNWAVDRENIAQTAYAGGAVPATGFLPSGYWKDPLDYHWEPSAEATYTYDLEKAKQELDAAGYPDSDGDGVREYKGEPIKLRFWAVDDKPEATRAAKIIAASLDKVGIPTELKTVDDGTASAGMYNYEGDVFTPDYDMFIWYWTGDPDPGFLLSVFTTSQIESWSDCNWSNQEYDALFDQQDVELDSAKRLDMIHRMQEIVYDESPYIVMVYAQTLEAYDSGKWEGWTQQPADSGTVRNYWTFLNVGPKTESKAEEGGSTTTWIAIGVVAAIAAIVAVALLTRRGKGKAVEES